MSLSQKLDKPNFGYLLLRVLIGTLMFYHGLQKFMGGVQQWEALGAVMANYGISVYPTFWGFLAMTAEALGGLLFLLGLFFRPTCALLVVNMFIALSYHYFNASSFQQAELALIYTVLFLGFLFIGPGRYSADARRGVSV